MDPKGFEQKPWFPYVKNMYDEIGENMMAVDVKGYEEKPWWPYVLNLQEKIDAGGGGGSSDFSIAKVTINYDGSDVFLISGAVSFDTEGYSATASSLQLGENDVILYKGKALLTATRSLELSGNITKLDSTTYEVSGDATITISDEPSPG